MTVVFWNDIVIHQSNHVEHIHVVLGRGCCGFLMQFYLLVQLFPCIQCKHSSIWDGTVSSLYIIMVYTAPSIVFCHTKLSVCDSKTIRWKQGKNLLFPVLNKSKLKCENINLETRLGCIKGLELYYKFQIGIIIQIKTMKHVEIKWLAQNCIEFDLISWTKLPAGWGADWPRTLLKVWQPQACDLQISSYNDKTTCCWALKSIAMFVMRSHFRLAPPGLRQRDQGRRVPETWLSTDGRAWFRSSPAAVPAPRRPRRVSGASSHSTPRVSRACVLVSGSRQLPRLFPHVLSWVCSLKNPCMLNPVLASVSQKS